ncbi:MAG: acyl-CoA dehydrogenase family protein [Gammaproteobacteria bacterium]|nr:acyl-CoA dehydrogenase family protein [Gammaproteobacteria bacterium]
MDVDLQGIARNFVEEEVLSHAARWERTGTFPSELHQRAGSLGLTLLLLGAEHGGPEADAVVAGRVAEELGAGSFSFALPLLAHNYVAWSIADFASESIKRDYLPKMLSGELTGIFSLTEPQSGSDATALQTFAERTADGWVISGEKSWVSLANDADFFAIYAQTERGAGAKGIAQFLVPGNSAGLQRLPAYEMLGGNAVGMGGLDFKQVVVPESHMLAPPGHGLRYALTAIDWARTYVAAICCGMLRQSLEEAIAYVAQRKMFGQTTAQFQAVQFVLADAATDLEAARHLTDAALRALSAEQADASVMAAHAKKFATRCTLERIGQCMQMMGANGMKDEHSLGRHFVASKMAQYLDGATEIQNVVISRALLRPHGVTM